MEYGGGRRGFRKNNKKKANTEIKWGILKKIKIRNKSVNGMERKTKMIMNN